MEWLWVNTGETCLHAAGKSLALRACTSLVSLASCRHQPPSFPLVAPPPATPLPRLRVKAQHFSKAPPRPVAHACGALGVGGGRGEVGDGGGGKVPVGKRGCLAARPEEKEKRKGNCGRERYGRERQIAPRFGTQNGTAMCVGAARCTEPRGHSLGASKDLLQQPSRLALRTTRGVTSVLIR